MSLIYSLKWSFASELAAKSIQPLVLIFLAQLLTPEDFGVMTAAMMVIAFTQIFWEAGMGKALIQRQTDIEEAANAAFLINFVLGIVVSTLLYLFAQAIARNFFQDDRVTAVLQVMTLQVLLGALSSLQTALLQKEMGFKKLFWVRFLTVSLPGLASIPLAWSGFGYWALVAGTLVGQVVQVILLWRISKWRPSFYIDTKVAFELWRFGRWVLLTGLLGWFYQWADSLIVGMYMSSHDLGLYRTGNQFVILIYTSLAGPLTPVIYSWMARKKTEQIRAALQNIVSILALVFIPLSFVVYLEAGALSKLLFDSDWLGIDKVIAVMALSHGLSFLLVANPEAYRAKGNPHYETYPLVVGLIIFVPVYTVAASQGLEVFIYARLMVVAAFGFFVHTLLAKSVFNIPIIFFCKYILVFVIFLSLAFFVKNYMFGVLNILSSITLVLFVFIALVALDKDRYKRIYVDQIKIRLS